MKSTTNMMLSLVRKGLADELAEAKRKIAEKEKRIAALEAAGDRLYHLGDITVDEFMSARDGWRTLRGMSDAELRELRKEQG